MAFGALGLLVNRSTCHLGDLPSSLRASVGLAVGYPLPHGGLLAASLAVPLRAAAGDRLQPLQVSLTFGEEL